LVRILARLWTSQRTHSLYLRVFPCRAVTVISMYHLTLFKKGHNVANSSVLGEIVSKEPKHGFS